MLIRQLLGRLKEACNGNFRASILGTDPAVYEHFMGRWRRRRKPVQHDLHVDLRQRGFGAAEQHAYLEIPVTASTDNALRERDQIRGDRSDCSQCSPCSIPDTWIHDELEPVIAAARAS